jgi:hypothetical protein
MYQGVLNFLVLSHQESKDVLGIGGDSRGCDIFELLWPAHLPPSTRWWRNSQDE